MTTLSLRRVNALVVVAVVFVSMVALATAAHAQEEEPTTTTVPEATTTAPVETSTTVVVSLVDCFYSGQEAEVTPPDASIECANAWSSGRQTSTVLADEAARDDSYRTPFMALAGFLVFFAAARTVRGWRR